MLKILEDINDRKREYTNKFNSEIKLGKYLLVQKDSFINNEKKELSMEDKLNINKLKAKLEDKYYEEEAEVNKLLMNKTINNEDYDLITNDLMSAVEGEIINNNNNFEIIKQFKYIYKEDEKYFSITFEAKNLEENEVFDKLDEQDIESIKQLYSYTEEEIDKEIYKNYILNISENKIFEELKSNGFYLNIKNENVNLKFTLELRNKIDNNINDYLKNYFKEKIDDLIDSSFTKSNYKGVSQFIIDENKKIERNKLENLIFNYEYDSMLLKKYIDAKFNLESNKFDYKRKFTESEKEYKNMFNTIRVIREVPKEILNIEIQKNANLDDLLNKVKEFSGNNFKKVFESDFELLFGNICDNLSFKDKISTEHANFLRMSIRNKEKIKPLQEIKKQNAIKEVSSFVKEKNNLSWMSLQSFMYSGRTNDDWKNNHRLLNFFEKPDRLLNTIKLKQFPGGDINNYYMIDFKHKNITQHKIIDEELVVKDIKIEELLIDLEKNYEYDFDAKYLINKEHFILTKLLEISNNEEKHHEVSDIIGKKIVDNLFVYNKSDIKINKDFFINPIYKKDKEELIDKLIPYFESEILSVEASNMNKIYESLEKGNFIYNDKKIRINVLEDEDELSAFDL